MNRNNDTNYLNLVNELINYYRNNDIMPNYNNTNRQSFFYPSSTSNRASNSTRNESLNLLTLIDDYNYNISQYNSNIREYQSNLRYLIDSYIVEQSTNRRQHTPLHQQHQQQHQQHYRPTTSTRTTASGHTYTTRQSTNIPRQRRNQITRDLPIVERLNIIISDIFQDVIVRPTIDQINTATTCFPYQYDSSYNQCSITMEDFEENEIVCRIKHCGHTFKKPAIMNWFERSVRCPICRYDIRNYREDNDNNNNNDENDDNNNNNNENNNDENDNNNDNNEESPTIDEIVDDDNVENNETTATNVYTSLNTEVNSLINTEMNEIINNIGDNLSSNLTQIFQSYLNNMDLSNNTETTFELPIFYYQTYNGRT